MKHVTGIDMTPAMLSRSAEYAKELGLTNLTWQQGDVTSLPFEDGAFSIVFTRFSFHHFPDPLAVLTGDGARLRGGGPRRGVRYVRLGRSGKGRSWNKLEKLRDPSRVRPGGGRRHDGKPDAVLHHAAHRLEARQAHAELKPPAEARGIVLDVLLQRAAGAESASEPVPTPRGVGGGGSEFGGGCKIAP